VEQPPWRDPGKDEHIHNILGGKCGSSRIAENVPSRLTPFLEKRARPWSGIAQFDDQDWPGFPFGWKISRSTSSEMMWPIRMWHSWMRGVSVDGAQMQ
jgi:hypothetical protein